MSRHVTSGSNTSVPHSTIRAWWSNSSDSRVAKGLTPAGLVLLVFAGFAAQGLSCSSTCWGVERIASLRLADCHATLLRGSCQGLSSQCHRLSGLAFVPEIQHSQLPAPRGFAHQTIRCQCTNKNGRRSRHNIRTEILDLITANTPYHENEPQLTSVQKLRR